VVGPEGFHARHNCNSDTLCHSTHMRRLSAVIAEEEYRRVERLVRAGAARSVAELVRLAMGEYSRKAGVTKLLNLREVPIPETRRAVERFLRQHTGPVWPDEMAEALGIDYRIVLAVVREFLEEGKVEEARPKVEAIRA